MGYRAAAYKKARLLELSGWVRNVSDGRVESIAEGEATNIAAFIEWCRRGPLWARVDDVAVVDLTPTEERVAFSVLRDS